MIVKIEPICPNARKFVYAFHLEVLSRTIKKNVRENGEYYLMATTQGGFPYMSASRKAFGRFPECLALLQL